MDLGQHLHHHCGLDWIGLDWAIELMDWIGLDLENWTHVLLCSAFNGVATGWTGMDMPTPLLTDVVPEIDANPVSFYRGRGGVGQVWSLTRQSLPYVNFNENAARDDAVC